ENLEDLQRLVAEKNLDFGIAFDGDGDRIGAIDGEGRVIWGDQLLMIYAEDLLGSRPGATIIADVKASRALFDRVAELGGKPLLWNTGHRSEEHTSELQSREKLVCRLLLEKE